MIRILYRAPESMAMISLHEDQLASALKDERSIIWVDIEGHGSNYGSWLMEKLPLTFLTGFFGMNFFGSTYEVHAPFNSAHIFSFILIFMLITPVLM